MLEEIAKRNQNLTIQIEELDEKIKQNNHKNRVRTNKKSNRT